MIAHRFGRFVDWVSIEGDREYRGQISIRHRPKPFYVRGRVNWSEVEADIMIALAGTAAEVVLVGSRRGITGQELDLAFAKVTTDAVCHSDVEADALREWLFIRTHDTLVMPPVWTAVTMVARGLMLNGEMSRGMVLKTIEAAGGP